MFNENRMDILLSLWCIQHDTLDEYKITYSTYSVSQNNLIMSSPLLRNGTYTFSVLGITVTSQSDIFSDPDPAGAPLSVTPLQGRRNRLGQSGHGLTSFGSSNVKSS